jgi:branched-chain amino acid aminotransferase
MVAENLARSDVYIAQEMFLSGTAAEISAVNSVDDRAIPCPGPITKQIAGIYADAVSGKIGKYSHWCELA